MSMGLKLMENMVNFSPDSDLLSFVYLFLLLSKMSKIFDLLPIGHGSHFEKDFLYRDLLAEALGTRVGLLAIISVLLL